MRQSAHRLTALIFALALLFQLAVPPAEAAQRIYFTAAGSQLLPLADSTMPFWSGGYLYVPSTMFTDQVTKTLGVAYLPDNYVSDSGLRILYGGGASLQFSLTRGYATGSDGATYYPGATRRGGEIYVPIAVVAAFFDLEYSVVTLNNTDITQGNFGSLVWIRKPNFGLSDRDFAIAATYQMTKEYNKYLKNQEENGQEAQNPPNLPDAEDSGKTVYLCLEAGSNAASLLDALDEYAAQAAFFCSLDFLETQGPLLRRMAARGHAIGLMADAAGDPEELLARLDRGNEALSRATMGKTRLVLLQNAGSAARRQAEEAGYRCFEPDLDRSDYGLQNAADAESLLRRISAYRGDPSVWLAGETASRGLRSFLEAAEEAEDRCLALTETVE